MGLGSRIVSFICELNYIYLWIAEVELGTEHGLQFYGVFVNYL